MLRRAVKINGSMVQVCDFRTERQSQARAARQSADAYTRDVDQLRMRGDLGGAQSALSSARHYQIDADGAEQEAQRLRWRADECRSQVYSERQQAQF